MKKANVREKKKRIKPRIKEKKVKTKPEKIKKVKSKKNKVKDKSKSGKISLFVFLISVSLLPLIISITIVSILSFRITSNSVQQSSKEMLLAVSRNLASHCVQNEVTIINATSHYDFLDSLKSQDIEVAIIFEDMSCVTSLKNPNGYRIREISASSPIFS